MYFKMELTNTNDELIDEVKFKSIKQLKEFYYNLDDKIELHNEWRGLTLKSYIVYEDEAENMQELKAYYKIFPENPDEYILTRPLKLSQLNQTTEVTNNKSIISGIFWVLITILFLPFVIVISAASKN
jgi:hypothetical protein